MYYTLPAVALLALYVFTAAPGAGFEDSVFFALSCLNADIPHAPGYPLYALLCHPFARWLPVNPALAASIFSALCAASTCAVLAIIIHRLLNNRVIASAAAMLYGVSLGFWAQANVPEVYSLNTLLFLTALYWALLLRQQPSVYRIGVLALVCALGLANHWPLFALAAIALPIIVLPTLSLWRRPQTWAFVAIMIIIGLMPYAYLWWRAHHPVAFMGLPFAPQNIEQFLQIVLRKVHVANDNQGGGLTDKIGFITSIGYDVLWRQYGVIGGMLAIYGFVLQWRRLPLFVAFALTLIFFTGAPILIFLLNFIYDPLQEEVFAAYPLLPFAAVAIWAAVAASRWKKFGVAALVVAIIGSVFINFPHNDRRRDTLAEDIPRAYFKLLPPGAWIPAPSQIKFAHYLQITENLRPDVFIVPPPNPYLYEMNFGGKQLYAPNSLHYDDELQMINDYIRQYPLCYNTYIPFDSAWQSSEYLLFSCLSPNSDVITDSPTNDFIQQLIATNPRQQRAQTVVRRVIENATHTMLMLKAQLRLPESWQPLLDSALTTPPGLLARVEFLSHSPSLETTRRRADQIAAAVNQLFPRYLHGQQARILSAMGDIYAAVVPRDESSFTIAKDYHARAIAQNINNHNPLLKRAVDFYQREKLTKEAQQLIAQYGDALRQPSVIVE